MAQIINPVNGHRGELVRKGIKPKNYLAEHRKELTALEKTVTEYKNQPPQTQKPRKLKQFTQVPARVTNRPQTAQPASPTKNYVRENVTAAIAMQAAAYELPLEKDFRLSYENYGKVPAYLHAVREDLRTQQRRRAFEEEQKQWPKGYRLLSEAEKASHVAALTQEREETIRALGQFKFSADSNLRKDQRSTMERRLNEVEFELGRLALVKVFVKT